MRNPSHGCLTGGSWERNGGPVHVMAHMTMPVAFATRELATGSLGGDKTRVRLACERAGIALVTLGAPAVRFMYSREAVLWDQRTDATQRHCWDACCSRAWADAISDQTVCLLPAFQLTHEMRPRRVLTFGVVDRLRDGSLCELLQGHMQRARHLACAPTIERSSRQERDWPLSGSWIVLRSWLYLSFMRHVIAPQSAGLGVSVLAIHRMRYVQWRAGPLLTSCAPTAQITVSSAARRWSARADQARLSFPAGSPRHLARAAR